MQFGSQDNKRSTKLVYLIIRISIPHEKYLFRCVFSTPMRDIDNRKPSRHNRRGNLNGHPTYYKRPTPMRVGKST
ncbi:hypothetical protein HanIR_Chr12g0584291 [Helianthus annuus]|nr:hypothetical protein HanIR_Chr12g0584291 [Helianthus annuus]